MKLECTKQEFRKMIIACNQSVSCMNCMFTKFCSEVDMDKGEFIASIVEIVPEVKDERY